VVTARSIARHGRIRRFYFPKSVSEIKFDLLFECLDEFLHLAHSPRHTDVMSMQCRCSVDAMSRKPMDTQPAKQSPADKRPSQGGILDGRTRRARRRRELIAAYSSALGGPAALTEGQRIDIRKAAELVALAEDCRALAMQEGPGGAYAISAMVRLESAADRAIRRLGLPAAGAVANRMVPLRERLRRGGAG
jgi:hypothetical protein